MAIARKLRTLGRTVAELEDAALVARMRPPVQERLAAVHRAHARRMALRQRLSLRRPALVAALAAAALLLFLLFSRKDALHFSVGAAAERGELGVWISAPSREPTVIAFSDGSRVRLAAGAQARVVSTNEHGARVVIERGNVRADVVPRRRNDWWVVGGPFEIHVVGTSFDARWEPENEVLRVTMYEGHVDIRGDCLPRARALSRGESGTFSCAPANAATAATTAAATAATTTATAVLAPPPPVASPPAPAAPSTPPATARVTGTAVTQAAPAAPSAPPATARVTGTAGTAVTQAAPAAPSAPPATARVTGTAVTQAAPAAPSAPPATARVTVTAGTAVTQAAPAAPSALPATARVTGTAGTAVTQAARAAPSALPATARVTVTAGTAVTQAAPAAPSALPATARVTGTAGTAVPHAPSWQAWARLGSYKEALAAAESDGFDALCRTLSVSDLFELATIARLAGKMARASEAYSAVRARFAGSDSAAASAFHLGQIAFDGAHAYADAHRWFATYLNERPSGPLGAEALGRLMEAEQRLGDIAAARLTAGRYLQRYPSGAHAQLARSLLQP
jgi:TolA-binding protein